MASIYERKQDKGFTDKKETSIPEAMQLTRHSDVKMTMKYTHIGIKDQHRAVQNLPWERPGSASETSSLMPRGIVRHKVTPKNQSP